MAEKPNLLAFDNYSDSPFLDAARVVAKARGWEGAYFDDETIALEDLALMRPTAVAVVLQAGTLPRFTAKPDEPFEGKELLRTAAELGIARALVTVQPHQPILFQESEKDKLMVIRRPLPFRSALSTWLMRLTDETA